MSAAAAPTTAETRDLLVDLVSIPSQSGEEDAVAERLLAFFEAHGREAFRDGAGNVRAPAGGPTALEPGTTAPEDAGTDAGAAEEAGDVLLTSHLDTVPGEIPVRVEHEPPPGDPDGEPVDVLWGRGSVDATGAVAAMAAAAVRSGAAFAGVVREETDSAGARHLIGAREAPAAVINGEPSGWDAVAVGYRGYLPATYRAETRSTHSSRPEPNAVQHATRWWAAVEAAFEDDGAVFESVTATPNSVDGGLAENGHAVVAIVEAEFRLPPGTAAADVRGTVDALTDAGTVDWGEPIPPLAPSPRTAVARALRRAVRAADGRPDLLCKTGTCDANLYAEAWDCPVATYGPGDSSLDHAPDERLPLPVFDRSVAVLERAAADLGGGGGA